MDEAKKRRGWIGIPYMNHIADVLERKCPDIFSKSIVGHYIFA
jgi:hypothetical protein